MTNSIGGSSISSLESRVIHTEKKDAAKAAAKLAEVKESRAEILADGNAGAAVYGNAGKVAAKAKKLRKKSTKSNKANKSAKPKRKVTIDQSAKEHNQKNPFLHEEKLLKLAKDIGEKAKSPEDIQQFLDYTYSNVVLQRDALNFLAEATDNPKLQGIIAIATERLETAHPVETTSGKAVLEVARGTAEKLEGLGVEKTALSLYHDYYDLTQRSEDDISPSILFNELSDTYGYPPMQEVLKFLFHAVGQELTRGSTHSVDAQSAPTTPHIEPARLAAVVRTSKHLQSVASTYDTFKQKEQVFRLEERRIHGESY